MRIDLKNIISAYGESVSFDYEVDIHDVEIYGEKPFQNGVKITGEIINRHGILELHGDASALYSTHCSRCTKPLESFVETHGDFILSRDGESDENDQVYAIDGDSIELDDIFIPALILDVDMTYLCSDDCKGLCQQCGKNLNEGECSCDKNPVDDRLAILKTLLEKK